MRTKKSYFKKWLAFPIFLCLSTYVQAQSAPAQNPPEITSTHLVPFQIATSIALNSRNLISFSTLTRKSRNNFAKTLLFPITANSSKIILLSKPTCMTTHKPATL